MSNVHLSFRQNQCLNDVAWMSTAASGLVISVSCQEMKKISHLHKICMYLPRDRVHVRSKHLVIWFVDWIDITSCMQHGKHLQAPSSIPHDQQLLLPRLIGERRPRQLRDVEQLLQQIPAGAIGVRSKQIVDTASQPERTIIWCRRWAWSTSLMATFPRSFLSILIFPPIFQPCFVKEMMRTPTTRDTTDASLYFLFSNLCI